MRRVLRKPAIADYLARELERLGPGHGVVDPLGTVLLGDDSAASVPGMDVAVEGEVIGRAFGPHGVELAHLLQLLAIQDSETRALARESLDRYKELTMIYSLSEKIIGARDAAGIGAAVCQEAARFLGCGNVAALLVNSESGRLELVAAHGGPLFDRSSRDVGTDVIGAVLQSGSGEIVNQLHDDPRGLDAAVPLSAIVCSPMKSNQRIFGALVAGSEKPRDFNAGDLQILNAIAAHAAAAIEVARLDRDLKASLQKPVDLIYGVDDHPPHGVSLLLGLQHVLIAVMSLAYPVLVTLEAGGSRLEAASVVSMSLIAMAIATALQASRRGVVGSGFLAPYITSAIYIGPSLLAARIGGLGLVFGMTMFAGAVALGMSQLLRRFRKLFPPEVSGVVVLMVGLSMVPVALSHFLGIGGADTVTEPREWVVGLLTLLTIVLTTVLRVGQIRLYATAIGIGVGYVAAAGLGLFEPAMLEAFEELPPVGIQLPQWEGLRLDPLLMIPFIAVALASNVKDAGLLITCQKANDATWKRPDTRTMSAGLVAGGLGNIISGAIGGVGLGVSAGSVGLSIATGATARNIGFVTAGILLVLAFLPKATAMLALIPSPVMGAGLIYVACHLIASGAELITSRMLDARRIYVIGLPLVAGVGLIAVPDLFGSAPDWASAVVASPLATATIIALGLNLALNVGVSSRATTQVRVDRGLKEAIARFFDRQGASWGARVDLINRAAPAITEWCEEVRAVMGAGAVTIDALYDEFRLSATVRMVAANGAAEGAPAHETPDPVLELAARTISHRYDCTAKLIPGNGAIMSFDH